MTTEKHKIHMHDRRDSFKCDSLEYKTLMFLFICRETEEEVQEETTGCLAWPPLPILQREDISR